MTVPVPVHSVLPELGTIMLDREGDTEVLRLVGDIDTDAVIAFEHSGASDGRVISVVDLQAVTFLSSTGIALLIRQTQPARERGDLPVLRGLTDRARRLLHITGTTALFRGAS